LLESYMALRLTSPAFEQGGEIPKYNLRRRQRLAALGPRAIPCRKIARDGCA